MIRPRVAGFAIYQWAERKSAACTRSLFRLGRGAEHYVGVGGYPKSGTTWISQMIGEALDLPVPREGWLPILREGVVHHHWEYEPGLRDSIYVVRDGRDVMVSEYVAMMNAAKRIPLRVASFGKLSKIERLLLLERGRNARLWSALRGLLGDPFDPADHARNFPLFVRASLRRPFSEVNREPWQLHVRRWLGAPRTPLWVRYEAMLEDPERELSRLLHAVSRRRVSVKRVREVIARNRFEAVTGRRRGQEDSTQFMRKGIAGDWINWFDRRTAEEFDALAGETLVEAGYLSAEERADWVDKLRPAR